MKKTNKRNSRIIAIKIAYQQAKIGVSFYSEEYFLKKDLSLDAKIYVESLLRSLQKEKRAINLMIQSALISWKQDRIDKTLNIILQLALAEKLLSPNLVCNIIIDEYLEITRVFAGEKAVKLCNAILSKMYEQMIDYRLSIAPMVGHTNRYFRYTMRKISQKILLFTEMISSGSILRGQKKKILTFSLDENPVICQLAGNNPKDMGLCAKIIEDYGYCGINLNIGCPSAKVQKGGFGVCLMKQPKLVSEIITEIKKNTKLPISIKTRIGIDEQDSLEFLLNFIQQCFEAGVEVFVLHARKALLNYNTRNNRKIPPINYNRVIKIKDHFPHLKIIVNGEITSLEQSKHFLQNFDGTMIADKQCKIHYFLKTQIVCFGVIKIKIYLY